jgi:cytochrome c oxidase subunit 2
MIRLFIVVSFCCLAIFSPHAQAASNENQTNIPVIVIKASRFVYTPNQLTLKKGQTVILEIEATDREHGFSIPALGVRIDAIPGKKNTLKITPTQTGKLIFFCDIFCGSDHEQMAGEIIVEG